MPHSTRGGREAGGAPCQQESFYERLRGWLISSGGRQQYRWDSLLSSHSADLHCCVVARSASWWCTTAPPPPPVAVFRVPLLRSAASRRLCCRTPPASVAERLDLAFKLQNSSTEFSTAHSRSTFSLSFFFHKTNEESRFASFRRGRERMSTNFYLLHYYYHFFFGALLINKKKTRACAYE